MSEAKSIKKVRATHAQIAGAREFLALNQSDLAKAAGISLTTLNMFESKNREPHESTREKIQAALEVRGIVFTNGDRPGFYFDKEKAAIPT